MLLSHSVFLAPVQHDALAVACHLCCRSVPSMEARFVEFPFRPLPFMALCRSCAGPLAASGASRR